MDKLSEQSKAAKSKDDKDIGVHNYEAGGRRQQLDGLWTHASEEVVGLPTSRLMTNNYKKVGEREGEKKKDGLLDTALDQIDTRGPPLVNTSKPHRIF